MSKYTTEVRFICEHYAGLEESVGYSEIDSVIEKARTKIFDFAYPIFDEDYRSVLESKILKYYYTREICAETVARWKLFLCQTLNEVMPYFNQLYKSELIKFDPMKDIDYTKDHKGDGTADTKYTDNQNDSKTSKYGGTQKYSDTPQGSITNLANDKYLTNATIVGSDTTDSGTKATQGTNNLKTTDNYIDHVTGKMGVTSYSKMLQEYRDTFLNIDQQVLFALQDCFFSLY